MLAPQVVDEMERGEQAALLRFVTGSEHPPALGSLEVTYWPADNCALATWRSWIPAAAELAVMVQSA